MPKYELYIHAEVESADKKSAENYFRQKLEQDTLISYVDLITD